MAVDFWVTTTPASLAIWFRESLATFFLGHWVGGVRSSNRGQRAIQHSLYFFPLDTKAAQPRFWPVLARDSGRGLGWIGSPNLDPTKECFLARCGGE